MDSVADAINISTIISIILNALVVVGGWFLLFKKAKPEVNKLKADAAEASAKTAESYANAARIFSEKLISVETELLDLKVKFVTEIEARDRIIQEQKAAIEALKDWAQRLVFQVKSLNAAPVQLSTTKRKKTKLIVEHIEKQLEEELNEDSESDNSK